MASRTRDLFLMILALLGMWTALLGVMFFAASREAATFNKFRDPDTPAATAWDALFSDLRIVN